MTLSLQKKAEELEEAERRHAFAKASAAERKADASTCHPSSWCYSSATKAEKAQEAKVADKVMSFQTYF